MTVRSRVRQLREQHKVGLRELARGTGLRPATLSELERNLTSSIDRATLARICGFFVARGIACTVGDLLIYEPTDPGDNAGNNEGAREAPDADHRGESDGG